MSSKRIMRMAFLAVAWACSAGGQTTAVESMIEGQLTFNAGGHILTNVGVWSPDGRWIVYDMRRREEVFDGTRIEMVNVATGEVKLLYESTNGAACGVATFNPIRDEVVFIHGPESPTPDWQYAAYRRRGVVVDVGRPGVAVNLDARDLTPPLTPGALRGGSHVHVFSGDGQWVSFTYEDAVLAALSDDGGDHDLNQRNVGVSVPCRPVAVKRDHPRNHDGRYFSVLATRTVPHPRPGSDEISKAFEEGWVGADGYVKPDGSRQKRALAFQGMVTTADGRTISEVFIVDLPDDVTAEGDGPLCGTATHLPRPPRGTIQRRLTHTADRKHPGVGGPRHWLRSSPDGSRIAFLMKDDDGIVQVWTVSPNGGPPVQMTRNPWSVASALGWSPDGRRIACVIDNSVFTTDVAAGQSTRLTARAADDRAPTHHACVFSPDGKRIAYMRPVCRETETHHQIFVVEATP